MCARSQLAYALTRPRHNRMHRPTLFDFWPAPMKLDLVIQAIYRQKRLYIKTSKTISTPYVWEFQSKRKQRVIP